MLVLEATNNEVADDNDSDNEDVDNQQNYNDDTAILVAQEPVSGKYDKEDLGNNNIMKQTWNACLFIFP